MFGLFCIEFVQILKIICSIEFTNIYFWLLQGKIDTFFPKYMDVFLNVIMKPNGHILQLYSAMIRKFGPSTKTLRLNQRMAILNQPFDLTK